MGPIRIEYSAFKINFRIGPASVTIALFEFEINNN